MAADDEMRERLTRVETNQMHFENTLTRLVDVSEKMSNAITQLTESQKETQRLAKQVIDLNRTREVHENRLIMLEKAVKNLEKLPDIVQQNTTVAKVVTYVGGILFTGSIGTIFALIKL